jgi:hypothetical protein
MGKSILVLLVLSALVGSGLTFAFQSLLWRTSNTMTVGVITNINIQKPLGTSITEWDWGQFDKVGMSKTEQFYIVNNGNNQTAVNCTVENLPNGFNVTVDPCGWVLMPNQYEAFNVTVTLVEPLPPGTYNFTLSFYKWES